MSGPRLIDLQRRLVEVGRIRMGTSRPGPRGGKLPVRLPTWRFTSRDEYRIQTLAGLYGGEPRPWADRPGEFELISEADRFPIWLLPGQSLSQAWELWGQLERGKPNVCLRRCDGERQTNDEPCACPPYDERLELAQRGQACKPTSRLSVILPELTGIGTWRLETRGVYAAIELAGLVDLLEEISRRGVPSRALLRIDQRTVVRPDATLKFPVPVIDVMVRPDQLVGLQPGGGGEGGTAAIEPPAAVAGNGADQIPSAATPRGYTPIQSGESGPPSVADAVAQAQKLGESRYVRRAEPVRTPPSARRAALPTPPDEGEPVEDEPPVVQPATGPLVRDFERPEPEPVYISDKQRRFLHARKHELGLNDEALKTLIKTLTGQTSTTKIPADSMDELLGLMEAEHLAFGGMEEPDYSPTLDVGPDPHHDRG